METEKLSSSDSRSTKEFLLKKDSLLKQFINSSQLNGTRTIDNLESKNIHFDIKKIVKIFMFIFVKKAKV